MSITKQNVERVKEFLRGQNLKASDLNALVRSINNTFSTADGVRDNRNLKTAPQLYIATETKGKWEDTGSAANGVIKCRPIRMTLYQEDGTNDDIIGEEVTLPKFWDQEIDEDDIGIAVSMGSGTLGFYAIKGGAGEPTITVKNESTANLIAGDVIYISNANFVSGDYEIIGKKILNRHQQRFAVIAKDAVNNLDTGEFYFTGAILANVDITDINHKYAQVVENGVQMKSTKYETRFRLLGHNGGTGVTLCQMYITAPKFHFNNVKTSGATTLIDGKRVLVCTDLEGNTTHATPSPTVDPATWDGVNINGVTYTRVNDTQRSANDGIDTWNEDLHPPYGTDEIITVLPNDYDLSPDLEIPYRETGNGKVWVRSC